MAVLSRCSNFLFDYGNILERDDAAAQSLELDMGGRDRKMSPCCGRWSVTSHRSTSRRCRTLAGAHSSTRIMSSKRHVCSCSSGCLQPLLPPPRLDSPLLFTGDASWFVFDLYLLSWDQNKNENKFQYENSHLSVVHVLFTVAF